MGVGIARCFLLQQPIDKRLYGGCANVNGVCVAGHAMLFVSIAEFYRDYKVSKQLFNFGGCPLPHAPFVSQSGKNNRHRVLLAQQTRQN